MSNTALTYDIARDNSSHSNVLPAATAEARRGSRPAGGPRPKSGDVLVSRPTARADLYETSVIPAVAHIANVSYEDGTNSGRQLARELAVDAWFTCDHTHVVRLAHYRM
jgi:hypothetical protein